MKKKPLKILMISYDWRNIFENNFEELRLKFERDRLAPEFNEIFIISWSTKTYYKEKKNIKTFHLNAFLGKFRIFYDFLSIFLVPIILWRKKFNPDVVLVYDFSFIFSGVFAKFLLGSRIVLFLAALPSDLAKTKKLAVIKRLYQKLAEFFGKKFIDYCFVISDATKKYAVNLGIKEDKIRFIYLNVIKRDENYILSSKKGLIRKKYNIEKDKKILLSVGRLEPEKGFARLIELFGSLKRDDLILIIAGDGILKNDLIKLVREKRLEDKIFFSGFVPREEIWNYYQDADIFILLSQSEGLGLVFWEAMHMNVPVIGSYVGGIIDSVGSGEERGYFIRENEEVEKLEKIINECLLNTERNKEKKKNAEFYIKEKIDVNRDINDFI